VTSPSNAGPSNAAPSRFPPTRVAAIGALLALLGVALGAFGTHVLREMLTPERLATLETGVRYQMYHALGLLAIAALGPVACRAAPWLLAGSVIFSGSLYLLVLTDTGWWGAVAPLGGTLQLAGWLYLAVLMWRRRD
jgi:uncharacterized membrane protein YgdD (TMEM256/DUF423 family)